MLRRSFLHSLLGIGAGAVVADKIVDETPAPTPKVAFMPSGQIYYRELIDVTTHDDDTKKFIVGRPQL